MKKAWSITSTASFLFLLIGSVVLLWWWSTGRLDSERLSSMYSIFMGTDITDVEAPAGQSDDAVSVPGSSARRLVMRGDESRLLAVDHQLFEHQATARQGQIDMALKSLAEARAALAAERAAFKMAQESAQTQVEGRDPNTQFQRSVNLIEAAQPAQAKIWILSMTEQGRFEDAVAALDAMQPRSASRILREFQSAAEMELAGKLLEALGRYGTNAWPIPPKELSAGVSRGNESSPTR